MNAIFKAIQDTNCQQFQCSLDWFSCIDFNFYLFIDLFTRILSIKYKNKRFIPTQTMKFFFVILCAEPRITCTCIFTLTIWRIPRFSMKFSIIFVILLYSYLKYPKPKSISLSSNLIVDFHSFFWIRWNLSKFLHVELFPIPFQALSSITHFFLSWIISDDDFIDDKRSAISISMDSLHFADTSRWCRALAPAQRRSRIQNFFF